MFKKDLKYFNSDIAKSIRVLFIILAGSLLSISLISFSGIKSIVSPANIISSLIWFVFYALYLFIIITIKRNVDVWYVCLAITSLILSGYYLNAYSERVFVTSLAVYILVAIFGVIIVMDNLTTDWSEDENYR